MYRTIKIKEVIFIYAVICFSAIDALAQDVFKLDFSKTGGKVSDFVQKQQENYQEIMGQISESQFATTIGKGIDAAKQGVSFAKDNFNAAVGFVNETKESVLNSNAYAMAQKSKEIADEKKVLQEIEEQKNSQLTELQSAASLDKTTIEEKIKQVQENYNTKIAIYKQELAQATNDEEKKKIEDEIESLQAGQDAEVAEFNAQLQEIDDKLQQDTQALNDDFEQQIKDQTLVIVLKTEELAELVKDSIPENANKNVSDDPQQDIANMMDDLSPKSEDISLDDKEKIEENRRTEAEETTTDSSSKSVSVIAATANTKDEQENISATSKTVNGKSETVYFPTNDIINQMETLQKYLEMELLAIKADAMSIITTSTAPLSEAKASIDICDYNIEEEKGLLDTINDIKDKAEEVKDKVNDVKDKIEEGKEMYNQIQDAAESIGSAAQDIGSVTSSVSGMF